jgi:cysteine-rich repeat protein
VGNFSLNSRDMSLPILFAIKIKFLNEMFTIILSSFRELMKLAFFFLIIALVLTDSIVAAGCGNGILEAGEQCDDFNTVSGDGCDSTCRQ